MPFRNLDADYDNEITEIESAFHTHSKAVLVTILPDGKKGRPRGNRKDQQWTLAEAEALRQPNERVKLMVNLAATDFFCLDIDKEGTGYYNDLIASLPVFDYALYSHGTTKGYHALFRKQHWNMEGIKRAVNVNKQWSIDLITDCLYVDPDEQWSGAFGEWTTKDLTEVFDNGLPVASNISNNLSTVIMTEVPFDPQSVSAEINDAFSTDMGTWRVVNETQDQVELENDSTRCCSSPDCVHCEPSHSRIYFNGLFINTQCFSHNSRTIRLTDQKAEYLGALLGIENQELANRKLMLEEGKNQLAKIAIEDKLMIFRTDINDSYSLCEKIEPYLKKKLRFSQNNWYALGCDNLWKQIPEPLRVIQDMVRTGLNNNRKALTKKLDDSDSKENIDEMKDLLDCWKLIDKPSFTSQVKKNLMSFLDDERFVDLLDKNKYKIAYKNGTWDIKTNTFTKGFLPTDYITQKLDFDYEDSNNAEEEEWLRHILWGILNRSDEHLEYVLDTLGYALSGDASKYQHFYNWVGQRAGNGKSTILESLEQAFPVYVGKGDTQIIETDYKNKHKLIPIFAKKRIVHLPEQKDGKKCDGKMFKLLSEGGSMETEVLYGNTKTYPINGKAFLVSNYTLNFDKCDKGCERRLQQAEFCMEFREEFTHDNIAEGKFVADLKLQEKIVSKRGSLLKILMRHAHKVYAEGMSPPPKEFLAAKSETIATNTEEHEWFRDNLDEVEGATTSKQEIIAAYGNDTDKKLTNRQLTDIMKAIGLFKYYDPNGRKRVGGKQQKGVFVGLKLGFDDNDFE